MEVYCLNIKELGLFGSRLEASSDGTAVKFYKPKKTRGMVEYTVARLVTNNENSMKFITALHFYLIGVRCAALSMFGDTAKYGGIGLDRDSYKAKLGMEFNDPLLTVNAVETENDSHKRLGISGDLIRIITQDNCKFDIDKRLWTKSE